MESIEYSIIVPVYNVEKVLSRCIESILNQTITNFELILVDDGSTDGSGRICDKYKGRDGRIKVVHNKNGGVSKARNQGLNIACGKYVVFVDSDDYVDENYLESFGVDDTELVITGIKSHDVSGKIQKELTEKYEVFNMNSQEKIIDFFKKWYSIQVYAKRFCNANIRKMKLQFNENFKYGEDSIFVAQYVKNINRVSVMNMATYHFCEYTAPSLSKLEKNEWIVQYTMLQQEIYNIFQDCDEVKNFLIDKFWWIIEKEISRICNQQISLKDRKQELYKVINNSFFQFCLKENKKIKINPITKYCFLNRWSLCILIKYSKKR